MRYENGGTKLPMRPKGRTPNHVGFPCSWYARWRFWIRASIVRSAARAEALAGQACTLSGCGLFGCGDGFFARARFLWFDFRGVAPEVFQFVMVANVRAH